jgi:hypothetical protein
MKKLINLRKAWAKLGAHRAKLRFCLRTTVAGLLAFAIAQLTSIPLNPHSPDDALISATLTPIQI